MHIPTATYRLQLTPDFGFEQVSKILDYLKELGISDIYASPVFQARPGSRHGYDVLDPNRFNPELGSRLQWQALTDRRQSLGLGWIQDIVPNHMAYSGGNRRIRNLLETGPASTAQDCFDIIWDHPLPELNRRLCAPFLGDDRDACLGRGEIRLAYEETGLCVAYFEHRFALALTTYTDVFEIERERRPAAVHKWLDLVRRLSSPDGAAEPNRGELKTALWQAFSQSPEIRDYVSRRLALVNDPRNTPALEQLLARQNFELTFWRNAARAINYRRFFSINELIAVRQEAPRVFEQTHRLIADLTRSGVFTGLRVDHIDGLLAPGGYLQKLRTTCGSGYLIVEKILAHDEALPPAWPVQGTTGYAFAAQLDRVFTAAANRDSLDAVYKQFCGTRPGFSALARDCKQEMLETHFSGDLDNLADKFKSLPDLADAPEPDTREALARLLVNMPVYRTYFSEGLSRSADAEILVRAVRAAADQRSDLRGMLKRLERLMLSMARALQADSRLEPHQDPRCRALGAFEQLCAALTAKGVEDTALYRYHRLAALNDVGSQPECFGESVQAFHRFAAHRRQHSPHALNALSTHDSKRCADVRANLLVLSEIPDQWAQRVAAWAAMNQHLLPAGNGVRRVDPEMEYCLYQTLAATHPGHGLDRPAWRERIEAYMLKAAREAKVATSWDAPDPVYEKSLKTFIQRILSPERDRTFADDLSDFADRIACFGRITALAQTAIQCTAPGVPDIYQGCELPCDSLVDPDNRRPVDYPKRRHCLAKIRGAEAGDRAAFARRLLRSGDYDTAKLHLTRTALLTRRRFSDLFAHGDYVPLALTGKRAEHGLAFARSFKDRWCLTAVPRFLSRITTPEKVFRQQDLWRDTRVELPSGTPRQWRNALTGAVIKAGRNRLDPGLLFADFPVALLIGEQ